jgi:hypothetical protein
MCWFGEILKKETAMRKLLFVMVVGAIAAAPGCSPASQPEPENKPAAAAATPTVAVTPPEPTANKTKQAWIYFTKNHNPGSGANQYTTDCIATVSTERIGTQKGDTLIWHIRVNNGQNDDDKCDMLTVSDVNLRFNTDVMTKGVNKKLKPTGMVIVGTVSTNAMDIGGLLDHKYRVYLGDVPAGPDPVVIVGCSSCGEPPEK